MFQMARDTVVDGRYRVVNRIGSGGMADVYCAEDLQLGRKVALKLLYRRFAEDEEFVERFRREASAAAGLSHPNIVQVFDRGEWDGTYYIAMEFLSGQSLKEVIRRDGPLDPERAIDVAIGILKAARFAHRHGVVHRDIKPHNAILDAEGRVKVTDFGIARAGASDMTETGSIMGTAQYLSPEQAQGHAVDARSDLYSVGIVLYELLTGRVPFDADSAVTIALKQVSEAPTPPSRLNPSVSPALEAVVMQALAKDPARRFQDADGFIAALEDARRAPAAAAGATRVATSTGTYPPVPPVDDDPVLALEEEDRRSRRWLWWLPALLVVAGAAAGAWFALQPEMRVVPDVVGRQGDTAAQILQNAGFEVNIETVQSETVRENRVATQRPQPTEDAEEGSTVTIVVSSGPGEAAIPDVVGDRRRQAERRIRRARFKVGVERRFSDDVAEGRVIETRPPARSLLERGRTVVLVVSRGVEQVEVPDVTGLDRDEAERLLRENELAIAAVTEETDEEAPGQVLRQDPSPGTEVDRGTTVTVTVAEEPSTVAVPDVVGVDVNTAVEELTSAGFRVRQEMEVVDAPDEDDIVLAQEPGAGQELERGSLVVIVLGEFQPPENLDPDAGTGEGGAGVVPEEPTPGPEP